MKICKQCNEEKPLSEFYSQNKVRSNGSPYVYYNSRCKECVSTNALQWSKDNHDRKLELHKIHNSKPKRRRDIYESNRRRSEDGKYREWQKENKDKLRQYASQRQHKTHEITEQEWTDCKEYFESQCAYYGLTHQEHLDVYGQDLHKEHVDHKGSNSLSNCVPSCKSCNGSKHTFDFEYWYRERSGKYSEERFRKITQWLNNDYKAFIEN